MEVSSLAEKLLFTTVRIDTVDSQGEDCVGTGFLFAHKHGELQYPFIVTNRHVVAGSVNGGITFIRGRDDKPDLGGSLRVSLDRFESHWFGHPDADIDIAVTPLVPLLDSIKTEGQEVFYQTLGTQNVPTPEQREGLDAIEDVVFVGYPEGIWDSTNFTPVVRRGITATPIGLDYGGKQRFLIDASVFNGSSGSPVFVYHSGTYRMKSGPAMVGTKFFFVGVLSEGYHKNAARDIISLPIPTGKRPVAIDKEMLDLGIVLRVETVIETIETFIARQSGGSR